MRDPDRSGSFDTRPSPPERDVSMILRRPLLPSLRPFVRTIWATDPGAVREVDREWVLPTGGTHLALRLSDKPLRIFRDEGDALGSLAGVAVVGGARTTAYLRDVSEPVPSLGAQLAPGASRYILGVPAGELAGAHTSLEDLWGPLARSARERLAEEVSLERRLDLFESILAARLPVERRLHPIVTGALPRLAQGMSLGQVVEASGHSHRHFISLFRREIGLSPKIHLRLLRFQRVLHHLAAAPAAPLADVSLEFGYSDQSHLSREFRAFAGISPGGYRAMAPSHANHLPLRPGLPR